MMVGLPLKRGSGLKLHTNAFSSDDLNLLIDALDKNFAIKATINKSSIKDPACAAQLRSCARKLYTFQKNNYL